MPFPHDTSNKKRERRKEDVLFLLNHKRYFQRQINIRKICAVDDGLTIYYLMTKTCCFLFVCSGLSLCIRVDSRTICHRISLLSLLTQAWRLFAEVSTNFLLWWCLRIGVNWEHDRQAYFTIRKLSSLSSSFSMNQYLIDFSFPIGLVMKMCCIESSNIKFSVYRFSLATDNFTTSCWIRSKSAHTQSSYANNQLLYANTSMQCRKNDFSGVIASKGDK